MASFSIIYKILVDGILKHEASGFLSIGQVRIGIVTSLHFSYLSLHFFVSVVVVLSGVVVVGIRVGRLPLADVIAIVVAFVFVVVVSWMHDVPVLIFVSESDAVVVVVVVPHVRV